MAYPTELERPRYPLPVCEEVSEIATNWWHLTLCPLYREGKLSVPCKGCIDRFLDGLEEG